MLNAQVFFSAMWLYLPAMVANMAPVLATKLNIIPWLNKPIDFGCSIQGERVFGQNKTIRGFIVAILAGACTGALLGHGALFGGALGFGAMIGDAIKSFFKRRFHVRPGISWIPFDQIDFIIGATIFGLFFQNISLEIFCTGLFFISIGTYIVNICSVALHLKKTL